MKLSEEEVAIQGDETFANLMAAMSILSDAQGLITGAALLPELLNGANEKVNHAKLHIIDAMKQIHEEKNLPGELVIMGGDDGDRTEGEHRHSKTGEA